MKSKSTSNWLAFIGLMLTIIAGGYVMVMNAETRISKSLELLNDKLDIVDEKLSEHIQYHLNMSCQQMEVIDADKEKEKSSKESPWLKVSWRREVKGQERIKVFKD